MTGHPIAVTTDGGTLSLACWQGLPDDAESGEHIRFVDPGDQWDEITADVARHQAAHGCGDRPASSTEDQDPLTAALATVQARNERYIRASAYTEWTVENAAPEGDVRRLLAALEQAAATLPLAERARLAVLLHRDDDEARGDR